MQLINSLPICEEPFVKIEAMSWENVEARIKAIRNTHTHTPKRQ